MRIGFTSMNTAEDVRPSVLARALEDRGYSSWWIGEHSHIPVARQTPYPAGGEMPDAYRRMMNPFVSLAVAAESTSRLRLGAGVVLVLEHDLLDLAKTMATLDVLSGGRLEVGVGVGWNVEELANHRPDIPWSERYLAAAEAVTAMRRCWTDTEIEFNGRYFGFDALWMFPKPLQKPWPRIWFGVSGPLGQRHAVKWADGWMPIDVGLGAGVEAVARRVGRFREAVAAAGRDPIPITLGTFGDPSPATLAVYRDLGVDEVVIGANRTGWDEPATTLGYLDRYTALVDELAAP